MIKKVGILLSMFFLINLVSAAVSEESNVTVTLDADAPVITIIKPKSIAYNNATPLLVNFSVYDFSLDKVWYSLNNGANFTITGPFYLELAEGSYLLKLYANDSLGRVNFSEVLFSINNSVGYCGDGAIDPRPESEEKCDGTNLNGQSCSSVLGGSYTGTLICTSSCNFDTTGCAITSPSGGGNDGGGGNGGGGNGGDITEPPRAGNITEKDIVNISGEVERIELLSDGLSFVELGSESEKRVIVDLFGNSYEISFSLLEGDVVANVLNGKYVIPKDDVLPISIGDDELYVGVESSDENRVRIVLGLNANLVREQVVGDKVRGRGYLSAILTVSVIAMLVGVVIVVFHWRKIAEKKKIISKLRVSKENEESS